MVLGSIYLNHGVKLADEIGRVRFNAGLVRLMLSCNRGAPGVCRLEWCQDDDMGPAASCSSGIKKRAVPRLPNENGDRGSLSRSLFQPPSRDWGPRDCLLSCSAKDIQNDSLLGTLCRLTLFACYSSASPNQMFQ